MNRAPSDDARFPPSSVPGWHSTFPPGAGLARPKPPGASSGRPARAPQSRALTVQAHAWLARIPPRYQPLATARKHPHIVNRFAELWRTPAQLPAYFGELLLSTRQGRQGFTFDVLTELFDLQTFLQQTGPH